MSSNVPQFTTPTLIFTFKEDIDLTQATEVVVSLESVKTGKLIEKTGNDLIVEPKKVTAELTQEESAAFAVGEVKAMVNWLLPNGKRPASNKKIFDIVDNLHRQVM